jgi:hypothetical protein
MNQRATNQQPEGNGQDGMGRGIGFGLPIGVALGLVYGIALENIALGIALGAGVGLALGAAFGARKAEATRSERIILLIALLAGLLMLATAALRFLARVYLGAGG